MSIEVRHASKHFGPVPALMDVSLLVDTGELVALLGPSGSGKSTLLRIIAGLEWPDLETNGQSSEVLFDGEPVGDRHVRHRGVGFVFQHYSLFKHLSVFENIAFGLRVRPRKLRLGEAEIQDRVKELLHLIQLETLAGRYPHQLSGGQRQRVALARALAVQPRVLLLDEPFGALDAKVRSELRAWLRRLHDELHVTSLFVTHDQEEALDVADRVVVMNAGRVEQDGSPSQVYHEPGTRFVMDFIGKANRLYDHESGKELFVRPHEIVLHHSRSARAPLPGLVRRLHSAGPCVRIELLAGEGSLVTVAVSHKDFNPQTVYPGAEVFLELQNQRQFNIKIK